MDLREGEIVKDIPGYENLYCVTNFGRIWSYPSKSNINRNGLFLKPSGRGRNRKYLAVVLRKSGSESKSVHRLVATAFIPNPTNKPQVNHKDGNTGNNYVANLEWVTGSENKKHGYRIGITKVSQKTRDTSRKVCIENNKLKRKLSYQDAINIRREKEEHGSSILFLANKYAVGCYVIRRIINKETYCEP